MAKLVNKFVKVTSDNECYESFKNDVLKITHASSEGVGYDESAYPEMLCSFTNTRTGEDVPCSLYEYEFEIVPKPRKVPEKGFYEMVRDHVVQNVFELVSEADMDTYTYLRYQKGNVNVYFPLPKKRFKEKICGVNFGLEDPHAKQFPNGRWKFNFLEDSKLDKQMLFIKFINHFDAAIEAL
jgi:hypothetical protein